MNKERIKKAVRKEVQSKGRSVDVTLPRSLRTKYLRIKEDVSELVPMDSDGDDSWVKAMAQLRQGEDTLEDLQTGKTDLYDWNMITEYLERAGRYLKNSGVTGSDRAAEKLSDLETKMKSYIDENTGVHDPDSEYVDDPYSGSSSRDTGEDPYSSSSSSYAP